MNTKTLCENIVLDRSACACGSGSARRRKWRFGSERALISSRGSASGSGEEWEWRSGVVLAIRSAPILPYRTFVSSRLPPVPFPIRKSLTRTFECSAVQSKSRPANCKIDRKTNVLYMNVLIGSNWSIQIDRRSLRSTSAEGSIYLLVRTQYVVIVYSVDRFICQFPLY